MERKVGEIFTYKGKTYQVVKDRMCEDCGFTYSVCESLQDILGNCCITTRTDSTSVIFKEINNMEIKNNQLTIDIPEGMNIDIVNSDLTKGVIKFKPKDITYNEIEKILNIKNTFTGIIANEDNKHRLFAIDSLMNIAKYYNKDWKPNWNNRVENKYFIIWNNECKTYWVDYNRNSGLSVVYFKNKEDAQSVIDNPNFRSILDEIYKY